MSRLRRASTPSHGAPSAATRTSSRASSRSRFSKGPVFLATDALVIGLRAIAFVALFQAAGTAIFLLAYHRDLERGQVVTLCGIARVAALVALTAVVSHYVLTPA